MQSVIVVTIAWSSIACRKPPRSLTPTCNIPTGERGVVIGGSIAEGSPNRSGIKDGQCANKPGQISYWLENYFKIPVINQGIGGQTCRQIMKRWNRDVELLEPKFVWLQCGHNDLLKTKDPIQSIKKAFSDAAESARINGFTLFVVTLSYNPNNPKANNQVDELNEWIATLEGPNVSVVPYGEWANSHQKMGLFSDHLHPSPKGYDAFMLWFFREFDRRS